MQIITHDTIEGSMSYPLCMQTFEDDDVQSENSLCSFQERKSSPLHIITKNDNKKYLPFAGATSIKLQNPSDPATDKDGNVLAGWREVDPSSILVRGKEYETTKNKIGSPGDLYRCVKADVFESQKQYPNMARRVRLPKVSFDDEDEPKTWIAPDTFVITVALPIGPPSLRGKGDKPDGAGYTVTMYFVMQQETRNILRRITAKDYDPVAEKTIGSDANEDPKTNAVRLLEKWCKQAPIDKEFLSRFKMIPRAENLKDIGLPKWISRFNGKPFLVKRPGETGFLFSHPELSCMEFDVSLHPFPYLTKKAIRFMKDSYFKKTVATFAFCLEGREEDELPECILGAFQLCYPDPVHAIQAEDFFAGKHHSGLSDYQ